MFWRPLRHLLAAVLLTVAVAAVVGKAWLDLGGPYLEALPPFPFCDEAAEAVAEARLLDALELAEAGGCAAELAAAEASWYAPLATLERCAAGVWTGVGEDAASVACAVASDLLVFGDVRDLTRQGAAWGRGDATDPLLIGLSAAGIALTFAPHAGVGNALLKAARRTGSLTRGLADQLLAALRRGAWGAVAGLSSDAGRIAARLGVARGTRVLAFADDAVDLAALARFVERADAPLLALRWSGKRVVRLTDDDALYRAALGRGPDGLRLAAERGGRALLARQPLLIAVAKTIAKHPEASARLLADLARWLLRWATWPWVAVTAGLSTLAALVLRPWRRRRRPSRAAGGRTARVFTKSRADRS